MIRVIEDLGEFEALREEWGEVLASSNSRSVFMTHEWLFTWWKHLRDRRQLRLLAAYDQGRLAGICPVALRPADLSRMTPKALEFLGSGIIGSDYLDVIVREDSRDRAMMDFQEYLQSEETVLQLSQLRRGSSVAELLAGCLEGGGWTALNRKINVCPYIDLAGQTWETYCASLGSSQRYNFQRRLKNLMKQPGFRLDCVRAPGGASAALDILMDLHRKRWTTRNGDSEAFQTPAVCGFHREFVELAAARGWLRLFVLWVNDRPAAALYGLRYGSTFSFYQSGFDPEFSKLSVGLVMMGLAIKAAVDEGCAEYDFLHGGEEYKFHWTQQTRELGCLELYPACARARFFMHAVDLNRTARRMARRVLQRA